MPDPEIPGRHQVGHALLVAVFERCHKAREVENAPGIGHYHVDAGASARAAPDADAAPGLDGQRVHRSGIRADGGQPQVGRVKIKARDHFVRGAIVADPVRKGVTPTEPGVGRIGKAPICAEAQGSVGRTGKGRGIYQEPRAVRVGVIGEQPRGRANQKWGVHAASIRVIGCHGRRLLAPSCQHPCPQQQWHQPAGGGNPCEGSVNHVPKINLRKSLCQFLLPNPAIRWCRAAEACRRAFPGGHRALAQAHKLGP